MQGPGKGVVQSGVEGPAPGSTARYSRGMYRVMSVNPNPSVRSSLSAKTTVHRAVAHGVRAIVHGVSVVLGIGLVLGATGCRASPKPAAPWSPKPLVHWKHLGQEPANPPRNEFKIVVPQPTKGLFPATMGVTRVALEIPKETLPDAAAVPKPRLSKDPRNEFLYWNTALDDQMAVSEVFPIDQFALGGGDAEPELVLAALRALHARLGLVYAVNEMSEQETEVLGVLYATATGQPLAYINAHAASVIPSKDDSEQADDLWTTDSRALVRTKFEQLVYACVRKMIQHDEPGPVEAPTGWSPVLPAQPVQWPPRNQRVQR